MHGCVRVFLVGRDASMMRSFFKQRSGISRMSTIINNSKNGVNDMEQEEVLRHHFSYATAAVLVVRATQAYVVIPLFALGIL